MADLPDPVFVLAPLLALLVVADMLYSWRRRDDTYGYSDVMTNVMMIAGNLAAAAALFVVPLKIFALFGVFRIFSIPWSAASLVACVVLADFCHYWWHRVAHEVRWMWADHVNHHSSERFNFSVGLRLGWNSALTPGITFFLGPMVVLGFPVPMIMFSYGLNIVYQFCIHTERVDKLPRIVEAVFNTPSHHRVHHGVHPLYLDRNFGGIFIVWDRLFGTFQAEEAGFERRYGIVTAIASFNILRVAYHEWIAMARDAAGARSPRELAGAVFGPPGWSRDGSRETSEQIRARWRDGGGE